MDSLLSFPVGLFHPLQHAGLSRRSPVCRQYMSHRLGADALQLHITQSDSVELRLQPDSQFADR